ncbi:MAG: right-handed parallel beta-helix repeat-containing protein [Armatimonadetes bacterium]|nr:right-handed parallel beta-helix repeat-containing protein [Armatimonadota bacterium]
MIKPAWAQAPEAEVHVWPSDPDSCRAFMLNVQVERADAAAQTLKFKGPECIVSIFPGDRFYVDNLPSELDAPGEWYLDRAAGRLSFRPAAEADLRDVIAPAVRHIVRLDGDAKTGRLVHDVRFRGLTLGCNDYQPGDGGVGYGMGSQGTLHLTAARDVSVEDCAFANTGLYALAATESSSCRFVGNRITAGAQGGVLLLDSDHMTVTDNTMEHLGVIYKHIGGVVLEGPKASDNLIAHNLIRDSSRYGISIKMGGYRNVIEYNAVHDTSTETHDTGAIEVTQGERDKLSDSVIRYNLVSGTGGYSSRFEVPVIMSWGIYLDSFAGGYTVDHNVCYRTQTGGIMLQGGRANKVTNNIFVDAVTSQLLFANYDDNMRGCEFSRNIVYTRDAKARLFSYGRMAPEVLIADHNLYWQAGVDLLRPGGELAAWRKLGFDAGGVAADPLFVDAQHDDYRLRPGSPALKLGFEPIDLSQIGPRRR